MNDNIKLCWLYNDKYIDTRKRIGLNWVYIYTDWTKEPEKSHLNICVLVLHQETPITNTIYYIGLEEFIDTT